MVSFNSVEVTKLGALLLKVCVKSSALSTLSLPHTMYRAFSI